MPGVLFGGHSFGQAGVALLVISDLFKELGTEARSRCRRCRGRGFMIGAFLGLAGGQKVQRGYRKCKKIKANTTHGILLGKPGLAGLAPNLLPNWRHKAVLWGRSPGSIEPSRLDSTGPGIRLPQVRLIAKHGSPRLYKKERIGGLIRLRYRRSEDCLGVAPIEGFVAITRTAPRRAESRARLGRFRSTAVTMGETLRLALDSLRAHKLRSFLT